MNQRSKLPIVGVLIVSLVAAAFTRQWAAVERTRGVGAAHSAGAAGLSRMNSYALALLLGGLRGPLVMFLWPSAESQKQEKNLEDFDTKIEWIRLLQEEFDSVHIFQIWNKAYNISVQMANLSNKYRTILDALEYGHSVDASRPNNINVLTAIAQVYFDKLGNSAEKQYYRERVRDESQARQDIVRVTLPVARRDELIKAAEDAGTSARRLRITPDDNGVLLSANLPKPLAEAVRGRLTGPDVKFEDRPRPRAVGTERVRARPTELKPVLDAKGNILPEYLAAKRPRPAGLDPKSEWNDGSELQYLKQYEPYPYGVSPWALGYNYYKRSQVLQTVNNQKHSQLGPSVIDSRPGLALNNWAQEELERGRRAEMDAFDKFTPGERWTMEAPTAEVALDTPIAHRPPIDEAIYSYTRTVRLAEDSIAEYQRHLQNDALNLTTYLSHMDDLRGFAAIAAGDRDYLLAMTDPQRRDEYRKSSAGHYLAALRRYTLNILTYCVTDELAQRLFPEGVTRANIGQKELSDGQLAEVFAKVVAAVPSDLTQYQHGEEFREYLSFRSRADARLKLLGA